MNNTSKADKKAEIPYWMALAHLSNWPAKQKNQLIIKIVHEQKISLEAFFSLTETEWETQFQLTENQIADLIVAKNELPNWSFLAEELTSQGFEVIPLNDPEYSANLKQNLKLNASPAVLYVKGNKKLLQQDSITIVGTQKIEKSPLQFAQNISQEAISKSQIFVSGFAKGIDAKVLENVLSAGGKSIIVLQQGVLTFRTGIRKYYKQIVSGDAIIVSAFHPQTRRSAGLAPMRNAVLLGLSNDIYVAQSSEKDGTWNNLLNALKRQRKIFVRYPESGEKSDSLKLISAGGIPTDSNGSLIDKTGLDSDNVSPDQSSLFS